VGSGKAKRDALMAQRRGTSQTSKATKEAIRNAQKKEVTKAKNKVITQKVNTKKAVNNNKKLQITFNTKTLAKDTPKTVFLQIQGALSKQKGKNGNNNNKKTDNKQSSARKVVVPKVQYVQAFIDRKPTGNGRANTQSRPKSAPSRGHNNVNRVRQTPKKANGGNNAPRKAIKAPVKGGKGKVPVKAPARGKGKASPVKTSKGRGRK
jgi:hypothetical protein